MEFTASNGRLPPGFRFHPTDVELFLHYLKRKLLGKKLEPELVAEVDIYQFHPADLKEVACLKKDMDWYFFCARGKKYGSGDRTNRATQSGYWKATGKDRAVSYKERSVGKVKTLVFHLGKPPKGERTDWVMHEYRLEESELGNKGGSDAFVLCKIFKKGGWGPRNGEQYGAPYNEEEWDQSDSGVTNADGINGLVSATEQVGSGSGSGDGSVSGVDQAPTPTPDGSNVASTSKSIAVDGSVDKMADAIPKAAADIASTSWDPVLNNVDDMWCADDFGIYDSLEDIGKLEDIGMGMELDELMTLFDD